MHENPLADRAFRITEIIEHGESVAILDTTTPTVEFYKRAFSAKAGVNTYKGTYEVDAAGRIVTGEIRTTLIGSRLEVIRQEHRISRALSGNPRIEVEGDKLRLAGDELVLGLEAI